MVSARAFGIFEEGKGEGRTYSMIFSLGNFS